MKAFVVLGTARDPHVSWVVDIMRSEGAEVIILDHNEDVSIDLLVSSSGNHRLVYDNKTLTKDILIWDRQKLMAGIQTAPSGKTYEEKRVADLRRKEWRALYATLTRIYVGSVLNELSSRIVMTKPIQQIIAGRVGLKCPNTIVSNNKDSFLRFSNEESNLVMKTFSGNKILPKENENDFPYNPMTMKIERRDLENAHPTQFLLCPHMMQQQIKKKYELRIVIVNRKVLAFKVDSQFHEFYATDWRRGNSILEFVPTQIPEEIKRKLLAYMREMKLFSGSIDMIVDPDGQYWFLECNQDGQWGFLERFCNNAVAKAFAEEFLCMLKENGSDTLKTSAA